MGKTENKVVFIEMKNQEGGRKSPEQKAWVEILAASEGVDAYFSSGWKEAKVVIEKYFYYET